MTLRARAASAVAIAVASAVTLTTTAHALTGNTQPALPADLPTKVAVVAQGAPVGSAVAVLVRNGTSAPVRDLRLRATAPRGTGRGSVRARSSVIVPSVVGPGELAIARVDFGKDQLAPATSVDVKVQRARKGGAPATALTVRGSVLSPPMEGNVAQTLTVTLANDRGRAVAGGGRIGVMCLGEARNPVLTVTGRVPRGRVAPGATTTATVALPQLCPSYLVGLSDPA